MEMEQTTDTNGSNARLEITPNMIAYLNEIASWAKFLAIIGFIGVGLMVIGGFSFASIMAMMPNTSQIPFASSSFGLIYLLFAAIYFFPVYYLWKFSSKMKNSLAAHNTIDMEVAFENLKSHYKFMGILMIVILSLYLLIFLFGVMFASMF